MSTPVDLKNLPSAGTSLIPGTDNVFDLGSSSAEFKDLYIDGTANIDVLSADTVTYVNSVSHSQAAAATTECVHDNSESPWNMAV